MRLVREEGSVDEATSVIRFVPVEQWADFERKDNMIRFAR